MSQVTYKNSNNNDVVTLDTSTEDGKRDADRLDTLDNWTRTSAPDAEQPVPPVKVPPKGASRAALLKFVQAHASDAEQATFEQMTDEALRDYADGKGLGAGAAPGV